MKNKFFIAVLLLIKSMYSFAQPVPAGSELQELVRIAEIYANIPSLNFSVGYSFDDCYTSGPASDSMWHYCKISYGKTFMSNNEMEMLHGQEFTVYVDKVDSIVMVLPRDHKNIFEAPILDSVFREAHVLTMSVAGWDTTTWKLSITFKPGSYYQDYDILYDRTTGLIKKISYRFINVGEAYGIPSNHIVLATVNITGYQPGSFDPAVFNESRYFYRLNGSFYLQQAWQGFEIQY